MIIRLLSVAIATIIYLTVREWLEPSQEVSNKMKKVTYTQVKAAKDQANKALDLIAKKYNADQFTIDCTKMSDEDYQVYVAIDDAIQKLKQILQGEYGE